MLAGQREIPHGTVSGYTYWCCRCDACREAKNRYQREHGYNRRVGLRKQQKEAAELAERHPCRCGRLISRQAARCPECRAADRREETRKYRELVEDLWRQGLTCPEMSWALGIRKFTPGAYRQLGYDLPHRRTPGEVAHIRAARYGDRP